MSVEIKYKGNTIASASTDTTKTIKTSGKYCEGDIEVINTQDGGITPTGTLDITENGLVDVAQYANANVNVSGGAEITDGIAVKARDANGYATEVDFYGTIIYRDALCYLRDDGGMSFKNVNKVNFQNHVTEIKAYGLRGCPNADINEALRYIESISNYALTFCRYTGEINIPLVAVFGEANSGEVFYNSKASSYNLPSATYIGYRVFRNCTSMSAVTLGSIGHSVQTINQSAFQDCSHQFAATVFTKGSNVDTLTANIRRYAVNATIIFKASEDTTYGSETYLAGETILTSTPT